MGTENKDVLLVHDTPANLSSNLKPGMKGYDTTNNRWALKRLADSTMMYWSNDTQQCLLSNNQTVAGVKTFSSFPITPSAAPTTDYQVANKKYVDDQIVGADEWTRTTSPDYTYLTNSGDDVGIGTSTPSVKMEIEGPSAALRITTDTATTNDPFLHLGYDTTKTTRGLRLWSDTSTGKCYIDNYYDHDDGDIIIRTKGAGTPIEALTILGNAKVGIGISVPTSKFEVRDGAISLSDADVDHGITGLVDTNVYGQLGWYSGTNGGLQLLGISEASNEPGVRIWGVNTNAVSSTAPVILDASHKSGTSVTSIDNDSSVLSVRNNTSSILEALGNGYFGIGTITPDEKLDVEHTTAGEEVIIRANHTDDTNSASRAMLRAYSGGASGGDAGVSLGINGVIDVYLGIDNSDSDKVKLGYGSSTIGSGTVALTLDTSNSNISLAGDLTISGNNILDNGGAWIDSDGSGNSTMQGNVNINGVCVPTRTSGEMLRLNATDTGTPNNWMSFFDGDGQTGVFGFEDGSVTLSIQNKASGDVSIYTNSLRRFSVQDDGSIDILDNKIGYDGSAGGMVFDSSNNATFDNQLIAEGGLRIPRFTNNVSNPPTDAELDSAIGVPSVVGEGYIALVDDNDAGTNVYLVASTGTDADKWWILTLTQAA